MQNSCYSKFESQKTAASIENQRPQSPAIYFRHLLKKQRTKPICPPFFEQMNERDIIWFQILPQVFQKLRYAHQTYFQALAIFDQLFSICKVPRHLHKAVSLVILDLGAKVRESRDTVLPVAQLCASFGIRNPDVILTLEKFVLVHLRFEVHFPIRMDFLQVFNEILQDADGQTQIPAKGKEEAMFQAILKEFDFLVARDSGFLKFSVVENSCVVFISARMALSLEPVWPFELRQITGLDERRFWDSADGLISKFNWKMFPNIVEEEEEAPVEPEPVQNFGDDFGISK